MIFSMVILIIAGMAAVSCKKAAEKKIVGNPFFAEFDTPFQVPPFDIIKPEHFIPAYEKGMEEEKAEVDAIINNADEPDFDNTIAALARTGKLLSTVSRVFGGLSGANTNDELKAIQKEMSPRLAAHNDEINLNEKLFQRIKAVYEKREELNLNPEQAYILENMYKGYVRNGANLNDEDKAKLMAFNPVSYTHLRAHET